MNIEDIKKNIPEDNKTGFFEYQGLKILFLDLNGVLPKEIIPRVEWARKIIYTEPEHSVLMITDFTNTRYDKETAEFAKKFSKDIKPYIKKSALLGIEGLKKIIMQAMISFSGRKNMKAFSNIEKATNWLIKE